MKPWVRKIADLKQEERCMEENEMKTVANENFTYTVQTPKVVKHNISGTGTHVTNCLNCNYTCHKNCDFANDHDKIKFYAMKLARALCAQNDVIGKCMCLTHGGLKLLK